MSDLRDLTFLTVLADFESSDTMVDPDADLTLPMACERDDRLLRAINDGASFGEDSFSEPRGDVAVSDVSDPRVSVGVRGAAS